MATYEQLIEMQNTYLAASQRRVDWPGDRSLGLAEQISILARHLADQMIPIESPPLADDKHVAIGCLLFSNPSLRKIHD
jgi:hypothetical protein